MRRPLALAALAALLLASDVRAQPAAQALDPPWPQPDPKSWWDEPRPKPPEAADPLGGRKVGREDAAAGLDGDPLLYRLWGLPPLQTQVLRRGEAVMEVWVRPSLSVRQTVARLTVRQDGKVFVQARAGLGCCTPQIGRRVGFDAELEDAPRDRLLALADDPLWDAPRDVVVSDGSGAADALCVDGASFDLFLLTDRAARHVRRACAPEAVGQAAPVLQAVLGAALGHEPRIDVLFPAGANFAQDRAAYEAFLAQGGRLKAAPKPSPQTDRLDGLFIDAPPGPWSSCRNENGAPVQGRAQGGRTELCVFVI